MILYRYPILSRCNKLFPCEQSICCCLPACPSSYRGIAGYRLMSNFFLSISPTPTRNRHFSHPREHLTPSIDTQLIFLTYSSESLSQNKAIKSPLQKTLDKDASGAARTWHAQCAQGANREHRTRDMSNDKNPHESKWHTERLLPAVPPRRLDRHAPPHRRPWLAVTRRPVVTPCPEAEPR